MRHLTHALWLPGLVIAAIASGPAVGQQGQTASNDGTEIVCRRSPSTTGSRLGRRNICKTQAQWDTEQAQYREEVRRQQDLSHQSFGNE